MAKKPEKGKSPKKAEKAASGPENGSGGMSEAQIRKAGAAIDIPFEAPDPGGADLKYAPGAAETWAPGEGLQMGGHNWADLPPVDPALLKRLGLAQTDGDSDSAPDTAE